MLRFYPNHIGNCFMSYCLRGGLGGGPGGTPPPESPRGGARPPPPGILERKETNCTFVQFYLQFWAPPGKKFNPLLLNVYCLWRLYLKKWDNRNEGQNAPLFLKLFPVSGLGSNYNLYDPSSSATLYLNTQLIQQKMLLLRGISSLNIRHVLKHVKL